jgi:catechol 2,3-dioxygenase-like lactoylglutathione lyase family enzyme
MALELDAFCIDALDPAGLARFWSGLLGGSAAEDARGGWTLHPADDLGFRVRLVPDEAPRTGRHQFHPDLTSTSLEDQRRTVARALDLGGRHHDVGQRGDEGHVVLADPEGNEFCVLEPGNRFLAGCPLLGALSGDGSHATGCFWSEALGWPLVWDQDEETAIQAPGGGPKLTWGGPPLHVKQGKERVHLDLVPTPGSDQRVEVERLLSLGARHADIGQGDVDWVVLADPDGHELCVLRPR